jgi:mono/diheme cytochrome c family protein
MTRQRASAACLALLLMVARQQHPHLAAARNSDDPTLPTQLAETGLFAPDGSGAIAAGNRPFAPQYPLWTDGAAKRRWIHLPAGTTIDASNPRQWEFPIGTRLWKEFSFAGRPVETRVLWKTSDAGWLAGSYVWNKEGTDAVLAQTDGIAGAMEIAPGRQHNIPSRSDCAACHGEARRPLGFNPLQLSNDRDPNAIHGEALTPDMVTLQTLFDEGLLTGADPALRQTLPRIAADDPQTRAVLGYLSGNCGACHNGDGQISAQLPSFAYPDVVDGRAIVRQLVGQPSRWQAPGRPEGTMLIDPVSPESSAVLLRMSSRRPSSQMPPLGTVLQDREAIETIREWISGGQT